jgi:hypothetical protein
MKELPKIERRWVPDPRIQYAVSRLIDAKRAALLCERVRVPTISKERRTHIPAEIVDLFPDAYKESEWAEEELINTLGPEHPDWGEDDQFMTVVNWLHSRPDYEEKWWRSYVGHFYYRMKSFGFNLTLVSRDRELLNDILEEEDEDDPAVTRRDIAYLGAMNNIPLIRPNKVSWEQIKEVRQDLQASERYRNLHLWLQTGLSATTVNQATELIAKTVEDYK